MSNDAIYENYLHGEYAVERDNNPFIITSDSCYWLNGETLWLINNLSRSGSCEEYIKELSSFGIERPEIVFTKLVDIEVLRIREKRNFFRVLAGYIFTPKIRLFPAQWQEKILRKSSARLSSESLRRAMTPLLLLSVIGTTIGLIVALTGLHFKLGVLSNGEAQTLGIFVIVVLSSLAHELGHSFAAAASGIGFRPIGISVYLFYPVFFTNVSGIEKVSFWKKVMIDCGGFIAQSAYLWILMIAWVVYRNISLLESIRWTALLMTFNLNPLLRTDAYWLYRDIRDEIGNNRFMDIVHYIYLFAFTVFSAYILFRVLEGIGPLINSAAGMIASPSLFLHTGYKILLGFYLMLMASLGSITRLKESHQELRQLRTRKTLSMP
jgi:hypothetical protein